MIRTFTRVAKPILLAAMCLIPTGAWAQPAVPCLYPYPGVASVFCMNFETGNPENVTGEIDTAKQRAVVVQASFGQPGREHAFVNLVSTALQSQAVVVQYAISTPAGTMHYWHRRTLGAGARLSIGLHEEPEIFARQNMSIVGFFAESAALEFTVYAEGDTVTEVGSKSGVLQKTQ